MSLRTQLSLLNSLLAAVILTFFGGVVYLLVSVMLVDQIDLSLSQTARSVINSSHINSSGELEVGSIPTLEIASTTYIQIWDGTGKLLETSSNIGSLLLPLDGTGLRYPQPIYRDAKLSQVSLRVLTVPLEVNGRRMAVLQVGTNRELVDQLQRILLTVLGFALAISVTLAGLYGYMGTSLVLSPLEKVTEAARSIANKADLSRRIPEVARKNEIGVLIEAFNQTLDRLEDIFNKQKRFIADVSHELRTPLTVIKGNAGLLRRMKTPDEESLKGIETEVDRLTRMVSDLLLLAQAESGKLEMEYIPLDLDTLAMELFQQAKVLSGDKVGIRIDEMEPVQMKGDPDRLKQVVLNLITNAVKYTPAGGEVGISVKKVDGQAQIKVTDTGPGIPAPDLPHIFERFYRGDKARTRSANAGSYGLGLSIVYWIVKNHGGNIEVKSKEGQGTTFIVWLPLAGTKQS